MMYTVSTKRVNNDGTKQDIYTDIQAIDIIMNDKGDKSEDISENSPVWDYFVFLKKEYTDVKIWDSLYFIDNFWDQQKVKVISRDYLDFECKEAEIELLCKLN